MPGSRRGVQAGSRRRGAALEHAVLDAAWDELRGGGYANLTMDAVADRARTSRPVLYRRWADRADLAVAAIRHAIAKSPVTIPDTGTLRGDLIGLMQQISKRRALFAVVISLQMSEYFAETSSTLGDLRESLLQGTANPFDVVLERWIERGELHRERITPRVASLLPDLVRNEVMTTRKPLTNAVIAELVDDIFLPLVAQG
jgi:AcrR family transcriptional regulator